MQPKWSIFINYKSVHHQKNSKIRASADTELELQTSFHLDSLLMTRMSAPFSSFSLWLSDFSSVKIWDSERKKLEADYNIIVCVRVRMWALKASGGTAGAVNDQWSRSSIISTNKWCESLRPGNEGVLYRTLSCSVEWLWQDVWK